MVVNAKATGKRLRMSFPFATIAHLSSTRRERSKASPQQNQLAERRPNSRITSNVSIIETTEATLLEFDADPKVCAPNHATRQLQSVLRDNQCKFFGNHPGRIGNLKRRPGD